MIVCCRHMTLMLPVAEEALVHTILPVDSSTCYPCTSSVEYALPDKKQVVEYALPNKKQVVEYALPNKKQVVEYALPNKKQCSVKCANDFQEDIAIESEHCTRQNNPSETRSLFTGKL